MIAVSDPTHSGTHRPSADLGSRAHKDGNVKVTLPTGHPYTTASGDQVDPWTLAADAIAYRRQQFGGWKMMADDPDPDDDDDDEDDDEEGTAHPDDTVKVGDRTFKVSELQTIMAREKRQGKKSGRTGLLKELGFESLEAAKEALASAGAPPADKSKDDDQDVSDAAKAAAAREAAAAKREKEAARKARRADLRGILRDNGVQVGDDLDDAYALLDREIDAEYDEDDLEEAVDQLKSRRPILFADGSKDDDEEETPPARPRASLPKGGSGRRQGSKPQPFGAAGLERARQKGWVKDAS